MNRMVCYNDVSNYSFSTTNEDEMLWVMAMAIILSLINFIAIFHYFYGMAEHLRKLQKAHDQRIRDQKKRENIDVYEDEDIDHDKELMDTYMR